MDDQLMQKFLDETWENLSHLETDLEALKLEPGNTELLAAAHRAMYAIKGSSGTLGFGGLDRIVHAVENVLGQMRDGALNVNSATISLILGCVDRIKDLLDGLEATGEEQDIDLSDLIRRLDQLAAESTLAIAGTPESAAAVGESHHASPHFTRMRGDLLDRLSYLVGKLSLTRNELLQRVRCGDESLFAVPISQLDRITTELEAVAKKSRMQPISDAFRRLPRLVRELACITGKPMELELRGGELELDHTLLDAIRSALMHLVRNAANHGIESPAERLSLGKPAAGRLTITACCESEDLILAIEDDGAGINRLRVAQRALEQGLISEEEAPHLSDGEIVRLIMRPAFSTTVDVTPVCGRGVGLDVVRMEIECIGGTLEMTFVPGRGTNVRITLPLSPVIATEKSLAPPETPPQLLSLSADEAPRQFSAGAPLRALVIDDSMFFRQLLRAALEAEGYRVTLADAAERAIELLDRHNRFDVILCDIKMPGMDGCQFAEWKRTRPELSDTPLVAITSLDAETDGERILAAGFDRLLVKFNPQQLRETLAEIIPQPVRSDARISA